MKIKTLTIIMIDNHVNRWYYHLIDNDYQLLR